jgi:hypothetical protein
MDPIAASSSNPVGPTSNAAGSKDARVAARAFFCLARGWKSLFPDMAQSAC